MKSKMLSVLLLGVFTSLAQANSCIERRASFDIGSGSTKMKVYDVDKCENVIVAQIQEVDGKSCDLSESVKYKESMDVMTMLNSEFRSLNRSTVMFGQEVLEKMVFRAKQCGAIKYVGVATSAFRQANNSKQMIDILEKSGVKITKISQREEAQIGFAGALSKVQADPENICSWDIGGSSMQIVCADKAGSKNYYYGNLASIPFQNKVIASQNPVTLRNFFNKREVKLSPNPVNSIDYANGLMMAYDEARKAQDVLGDISSYRVLGIGGVHSKAIKNSIKKATYTAKDLFRDIYANKLYKTDEELGSGQYVRSAVTNLILVEGFMRELNINQVEALDVNLTEGLAVSEKFWK